MDNMTIDCFEITCEYISTWPMFEGDSEIESMAALSIVAKFPSVPREALLDRLNLLGILERKHVSLLAIGDWFDAHNRLASKLAERHGAWGPIAEEVGGKLGSEVFGGKLIREGTGAHWSVVRLRLSSDLVSALSLGASGRAIGLYGNGFDREWCESVVSRAMTKAHRKECLFVSAAPQIRDDGVVIRSYGTFGDPVGVDFVGRVAIINPLAAELTSSEP